LKGVKKITFFYRPLSVLNNRAHPIFFAAPTGQNNTAWGKRSVAPGKGSD